MGSKNIMDTPKIAIVSSAGHIITENTNCFPVFFIHLEHISPARKMYPLCSKCALRACSKLALRTAAETC